MTIRGDFQAQSKHRIKSRSILSHNHLNDLANWPDHHSLDAKTNALT